MLTIKFGTGDWRGLIGRNFTFGKVRRATQVIVNYLKSELANPKSEIAGRKPAMILGYDRRLLAREFSPAVAEVLAANRIQPLFCDRDTPTPVIAHTIRRRKAIGGINMTASHNPADYQGLKFSIYNGAAAPPEVTKQIEAQVDQPTTQNWSFEGAAIGTYQCKTFNPQRDYFKQLHKLVNFAAIKKAKLRVAVELLYGTVHGYLDVLHKKAGAKVTVFHNEVNPLFGGHHLEPNAGRMAEVSKFVRSSKAHLALVSMATQIVPALWTKTAPGSRRIKCSRSRYII